MSAHTIEVRIFRGTECITQQALSAEVIKVGRLKSCHICLDDPAISRMHSVIELSREGARWIDLDGARPTQKDGQNVIKNTPLVAGDTLMIGPYRIEIMQVQLKSRTPAVAQAPVQAPVAVAVAAPPAARVIHIDPSEVEVQDGTRVAEVVAMYGSTVLDVQHLGQTPSKRRTAPAWMVAGGTLALAGAALFGYEVSQDWAGYSDSVVQAKEAGAVMPQKPGTGLGGMGLALAFCGLVPFGIGMVRMGDQSRKDYTLGESHGASFHMPTKGLPAGDFPLVREIDGEYSLSFTGEMNGEVTLNGHEVALSDLITSGRAQAQGGVYSFPLASGTQTRVQHGDLTFYVNSVAPGAKVATRQEVDRPFWLFNGGSLAVLGSLLMLSQLIPADANAYAFEEDEDINRFVGYMTQADMEPEPEEELIEEDSEIEEEAGGSGQRASGAEGQMGDKTSTAKNRRYAIAGNAKIPMLGRNQSHADAARTAGILGLMAEESTSVFAAADGGMYTAGQDDADVFGGLTGTEVGTAYGVGGLGLVGTGRGGGGDGHGTIGLDRVGTIGHGKGGGPGSGVGRGAGFANRGKRVPKPPRIGKTSIKGALDKDVIRRVVRAHINEVRHCYNQGLARDPNLKGRVKIQFQIGGTGKVPMAVIQEDTVKDGKVGNCIAKSVRRWKFPRPRDGGMVLVTYPFLLSST